MVEGDVLFFIYRDIESEENIHCLVLIERFYSMILVIFE